MAQFQEKIKKYIKKTPLNQNVSKLSISCKWTVLGNDNNQIIWIVYVYYTINSTDC